MTAVLGEPALLCEDRGTSVLTFERLRLPSDATRLQQVASALDSTMLVLCSDAACTEEGQQAAVVGSREGRVELLAPYLEQDVILPVRLGEKIIWPQRLPAIRLMPAAQDGVRSPADALCLLASLGDAMPGHAVVLTDVATDSPLYLGALEARRAGYRLARNESDTHLFHRFDDSYAKFFGERSSKQRNQMRKKEKVFTELFGSAFEFREYRQAQHVGEFLSAAKAINRKTYQYRMFGESIDDDAQSVAAACRAAAAGCFRSFVLWHAGRPICFVLGYQRGDGAFEHRQTGFDPEFRDAAPGIFSNMLLLQRLYADDRPRILDFGSGDADYKRLFSNETRMSANPVLLPRRWRCTLAYVLFEASAVFNTAAVSFLERVGAKDWIKRRLRGAT